MSTQFNQLGQRVVRPIYNSGPALGGYPVEAGQQLGLFGGGPSMVKVKGYTVKPYSRRRPESAGEQAHWSGSTGFDDEQANWTGGTGFDDEQAFWSTAAQNGKVKQIATQPKGGSIAKTLDLPNKPSTVDVAIEEALQFESSEIEKMTADELEKKHGTRNKSEARKRAAAKVVAKANARRSPLNLVAEPPSYAWVPWALGVAALAWYLGSSKG